MSDQENEEVEGEEDLIGEDDLSSPSASELNLDDDQVKIAARVMNVLDKKNADGSFAYNNMEVRDFVCACIFEIGVPITAEIEVALMSFLDDVEIEEEDPTPEQLIVAVRGYFAQNPLNPELADAFEALGREELQRQGEGFKDDKAKQNAAAAAAGLSAQTRAPQAEDKKVEKPKVKKGLS